MARLVLVHGAFSGAWCWEPVIAGLEAAGHSVERFDLPGSGEDRTPLAEVTLDAYAERICAALRSRPDPAVLVGHSMGGVAVTQAAASCPELIAALIFVAAFMPHDGQSLVDLTQTPEGADDQIQANLVIDGDPPVATLSAEATRVATAGCCTDEQATWLVERRSPQAVAPYTTPVSLGNAPVGEISRSYVMCLQDRAVPPALQRRMIREHGVDRVIEIDTDHSPFASATRELVDALDRLAG